MIPLSYGISLSKSSRLQTSTSSRGNQVKWLSNGLWIKADTLGYEGLSEWLAYVLLDHSNLPVELYVPYSLCRVEEGVRHYQGCFSKDFLLAGERLITLGRLLEQYHVDIDSLTSTSHLEYKLSFVLDFVKRVTGLDFLPLLRAMLTLDALILNEDRHIHNIAFILGKDGYRFCPLFDNGLSLLSDVKEYPLDTPVSLLISTVQAKPLFSLSFDKPLNILGFGFQIDGVRLDNFLKQHEHYIAGYNKYSRRVPDILRHQLSKYVGKIVF